MSVEEAISRVSNILQKEGFSLSINEKEGKTIIKAVKGDLNIDITFDFEKKILNKLLIANNKTPGVTILKCDAPNKIERCVKKLSEFLSNL